MVHHLIPLLLVLHFVGDFLFQTRWMAQGKAKGGFPLHAHVGVYALVLFLGLYWIIPNGWAVVMYVVANWFLHLITDSQTSRLAGWCHSRGYVGAFWKVIGVDQLIHGLCLYYTAVLLK